jgi:hypothetical protein
MVTEKVRLSVWCGLCLLAQGSLLRPIRWSRRFGSFPLHFKTSAPPSASTPQPAPFTLSSTGTNLVAGQRRQLTVTVTDATGSNYSHSYNLRVIPAPPVLLTIQGTLNRAADLMRQVAGFRCTVEQNSAGITEQGVSPGENHPAAQICRLPGRARTSRRICPLTVRRSP